MDDVLLSLPTIVKARTEEIVIRNQDPANQKVDVYQSLRPMTGDVMGSPIKHFMRSVPVDADLCATVIEVDGIKITGLQVVQWLATWAARINAEDGPKQVEQMSGYTTKGAI